MPWTPESRKAAAERMRALHADPEFAEKNRERMRALNADPEFAEKNRKAAAERMRALNADPGFNPLAALSAEERQDYDVLTKVGRYGREAALVAIGRSDLLKEKQ